MNSIPMQTSAWKKLGTNVEKAKTWKEAIGLADLDWTVEKKQLLSPYNNHEPLPMWGNFRTDTKNLVGKSGKEYGIIQNDKVFDWVDPLIQSEAGAKYMTAGALGGGGLIWCLVQIPNQIRIRGTDDITKMYLLFVNFHEAGRSAIAKLYEDREICSNGMTAPFDLENLRFPHRSTVGEALDRGRSALGLVGHQVTEINSFMNTLAKTKLDVSTIGEIFRSVYSNIEESAQSQNRAREVLELFEDNDGNAFPSEAGTALALLNSWTRFIDHRAGARPVGEETLEMARARNALFGAGEAIKFSVLTSIVLTLSKNSLASFTDKEARAVGIRI